MNDNGSTCSPLKYVLGVDAIFAITLSPEAREGVELMWSQWGKTAEKRGAAVCALMLRAEGGIAAGVRLEPDLGW